MQFGIVGGQVRQNESVIKTIKSFTNWSIVFIGGTLFWFILEQNKNANGYGAALLPLAVGAGIMANYERRIRLLTKSPDDKNSN